MTIDEIIAKTTARLQSGAGQPVIIMVAGGSATGKSSQILPRILEEFGDQAVLVEQDWYQLGTNFTEKDTSPYKWDDPRNFQIERLAADLTKLRQGKQITTPSFDVVAVDSTGSRMIEPRPIIIVDGIYTLYNELKPLADYSIYASMSLYGRFLRRLFRTLYDQQQDKPQTAFKQVLGPVLKAHQEIVSKQAQVADCTITIPYSFADTIARYALHPQDADVPQSAKMLFSHDGLCFFGMDENEQYHLYITYHDNVYYDFRVDQQYKQLLDEVDFLSV